MILKCLEWFMFLSGVVFWGWLVYKWINEMRNDYPARKDKEIE